MNIFLLSKDTLYIDKVYKKGFQFIYVYVKSDKKSLGHYSIFKTMKEVSFIIIYNKIILIKVSILYIFFNYIFKK